jgi:hypothetical protein
MKLRLTSCGWLACVVLALTPACGDDGGGGTTETDPGTSPATEPEPTTAGDTTTTPNPTEGTDTGETTADPTTTDPTTEGTTGAPPPDPEIAMQCMERFANDDKLLEAQCECQVALGAFETIEECLMLVKGDPLPVDCICGVLSQFPESKAQLECGLAAQTPALACTADVMCVDDPEPLIACLQPYYEASEACGIPPKPARAQVEIECGMAAPIECGSGEIIPDTWDCNSEVDCADKSDENDCPDTFECADGTQFFPNDYKCDGYPDCTDMSDETEAMGCVLFMCKDGQTVPESFKCNGFQECRDGSDEGAEAMCPVFMCMNGQEIPEPFKCNGYPECCENDPDPDCMDESDEMDCPMFMCMDGTMIPESWKCDDFPDCEDGSDEADCP